ncbi:hypothetical protein Nepgr_005652 [Nepenthes gracilis]|uniref:DUF1677 family protein n=1 Tax=Nepenthes gracilis TaxID=150966 RepID=A0AAD3S3P2_NEPGR|nr:hypothetical protein Nepgr_005652 [Nepenthes gracilis]
MVGPTTNASQFETLWPLESSGLEPPHDSAGYKLLISKMSATIITEPMLISSQDQAAATSASNQNISSAQIEIEFAKCDCCGLTEECTPAYIGKIRERYMGKWICGLCAEAVKDEVVRSDRLISTEEALARHMNVCKKFKSSCPPRGDPTVHLIAAMRQILRRSLDSPRRLRSTPASPTRNQEEITRPMLARSGSCFPSLSG